jgi:predicted transcriptional regulator
LCETKINELEQSLVNLSERRREAILALKEEEREIRQLTDGNGSGE